MPILSTAAIGGGGGGGSGGLQTIWAYQDFAPGAINSLNVTLTQNQNGFAAEFTPANFYNYAGILRSDNNDYVYTTSILGFNTLVKVTNQTGIAVTLNKIPNPLTPVRIWWLYQGYRPVTSYIIPPSSILDSAAAIKLDDLLLEDVNPSTLIYADSNKDLASVTLDPSTLTLVGGVLTAIAAAPSGAASGDLSGSYPAPTVAKVNGALLGTTSIADTYILMGNGTDISSIALAGDVKINPGGITVIGLNKVTSGMLRKSVALSVIGNATNALADVADITAASDFQILRRSGTALAFGSINLASANAVGTSILRNVNTTAEEYNPAGNTQYSIVSRDIFGNVRTNNADSADRASEVAISPDTTDTTAYLLFANNTGPSAQTPRTNPGLLYNAVTNTISANLSGSASTVSTANEATDTTCFPLFVTASGTQTLQPKNNVNLTFNSNTGQLGASSLNLTSLTASSLIYADSSKNLASVVIGAGLNLIAGTLSSTSSGNVGTGAANQLAYYSAAGTTISGYSRYIDYGTTIGNLFAGTSCGKPSITNNPFNTGFGIHTLEAIALATSAGKNSAFGFKALWNLTLGSENTAVGYNSGITLTSTSSSNSLFGANAGDSYVQMTQCTLIGANAEVGNNNLTNATALGYGAVESESNSITLGNTSVTKIKTTGKIIVSTAAGSQGLDLATADSYANLRVIQNTTGADRDIYIGFNSGATSSLRLYSDGFLTMMASARNIGMFGAPSAGGGVGVLFITNATTIPTSNPAGGVLIYSQSNAAKVRGGSGTITTFGNAEPHCNVCGVDFTKEFENEKYGGKFDVCLPCSLDAIIKITGQDFLPYANFNGKPYSLENRPIYQS